MVSRRRRAPADAHLCRAKLQHRERDAVGLRFEHVRLAAGNGHRRQQCLGRRVGVGVGVLRGRLDPGCDPGRGRRREPRRRAPTRHRDREPCRRCCPGGQVRVFTPPPPNPCAPSQTTNPTSSLSVLLPAGLFAACLPRYTHLPARPSRCPIPPTVAPARLGWSARRNPYTRIRSFPTLVFSPHPQFVPLPGGAALPSPPPPFGLVLFFALHFLNQDLRALHTQVARFFFVSAPSSLVSLYYSRSPPSGRYWRSPVFAPRYTHSRLRSAHTADRLPLACVQSLIVNSPSFILIIGSCTAK